MAAALPLAFAADVRVVDEIAAKVNGEIITKSDLDQSKREMENEARQQGIPAAQVEQAIAPDMRNLLRDKIDDLLLQQKGVQLEIKVDPDVTRYIAGIQLRSGISDSDKFAAYVLQTYGVPLEELKLREKNKLLEERVIGGEVQSRVFIPEADLRTYYDAHKDQFVRQEEVFLSQILISTDAKTAEQTAAAEKKAKELVARLRSGDKFGDLAVANSDDAETGKNGGYLGSFKRPDLRPEIADVVFAQKRGYITDPIKLDRPPGFLILKVEDRHEAGLATFDEVRDQIQGILAQPLMEPKFREFATKLRAEAFLQIREGYVDTGAAPGKDTTWRDNAELKPQTTTKQEVAARQWKKFMGLIPYRRVGPANAGEAAQPGQPVAPEPGPPPTQPAAPPPQPPDNR
jgi:parvulin-like peptidyl-prolyl isomerase